MITFSASPEVKPVMTPYRGCAYHQLHWWYDLYLVPIIAFSNDRVSHNCLLQWEKVATQLTDEVSKNRFFAWLRMTKKENNKGSLREGAVNFAD